MNHTSLLSRERPPGKHLWLDKVGLSTQCVQGDTLKKWGDEEVLEGSPSRSSTRISRLSWGRSGRAPRQALRRWGIEPGRWRWWSWPPSKRSAGNGPPRCRIFRAGPRGLLGGHKVACQPCLTQPTPFAQDCPQSTVSLLPLPLHGCHLDSAMFFLTSAAGSPGISLRNTHVFATRRFPVDLHNLSRTWWSLNVFTVHEPHGYCFCWKWWPRSLSLAAPTHPPCSFRHALEKSRKITVSNYSTCRTICRLGPFKDF